MLCILTRSTGNAFLSKTGSYCFRLRGWKCIQICRYTTNDICSLKQLRNYFINLNKCIVEARLDFWKQRLQLNSREFANTNDWDTHSLSYNAHKLPSLSSSTHHQNWKELEYFAMTKRTVLFKKSLNSWLDQTFFAFIIYFYFYYAPANSYRFSCVVYILQQMRPRE